MKPYITRAGVHNGHVSVENVPVADESEVEVIIVPKTNISQMSFGQVQELTAEAKGSLARDISKEREAR
jgi:hypothetical protein